MKLAIENKTSYQTADIRRMIQAAARQQGLRGLPSAPHRLTITYGRRGVSGWAHVANHDQAWGGLRMLIRLPRPGATFTRHVELIDDPPAVLPDLAEELARVLHHEVLHWAGVRHQDMTTEAFDCSGTPRWFNAAKHILREKAAVK